MDIAPFSENERSTIKRAIDDLNMAIYHLEYYSRVVNLGDEANKHHKHKALEFIKKANEPLEAMK